MERQSVGFFTGHGKPVEVSEEALQKARRMLNDFILEDGEEQEDAVNEDNDKSVQNENEIKYPPAPHQFPGFQGISSSSSLFTTGHGKPVEISAEALKKVKHMFQEDDNAADIKVSTKIDKIDTPLCTTIKQEAICTTPKLPLHDRPVIQNSNLLMTKGYSVGLSKIKRKSAPLLSSTSLSSPGFSLTGAGRKANLSDGCLKPVQLQRKFNSPFRVPTKINNSNSNAATPTSTDSHNNFSTANGNIVPVSKSAVEYAQNTFKGADDADDAVVPSLPKVEECEHPTSITTTIYSSSSSSVKQIKQEDAYQRPSSSFLGVPPPSSSSSLFATASGKPVQISEEALKKIKNIFQDDESDAMALSTFQSTKSPYQFNNNNGNNSNNDSKIVKTAPIAFCTGNGKPVQVSDEALIKARSLFSGIDDDAGDAEESENSVIESNIQKSTPKMSTPYLVGRFSTASGKFAPTVPKTPLDRVKNTWQAGGFEDLSPIKPSPSLPSSSLSLSLKRNRSSLVEDEHESLDNNKFKTPIKTPRMSLNATATSSTTTTPNFREISDVTESQIIEMSKALLDDDEESGFPMEDQQQNPMEVDEAQESRQSKENKENGDVGDNDEKQAVPVSIGDLVLWSGGEIPLIHSVIVRIYPLVFCCKLGDGKSVLFSRTTFDKIQKSNEEKRQSSYEKICSQVEKEFEDLRKASKRKSKTKIKGNLENQPIDVLLDMMDSEEDFCEMKTQLSNRKLQELQDEFMRQGQVKREEIQKTVALRMKSCLEVDDREAYPCLRIRLLDKSALESNARNRRPSNVLFCIYRPYEQHMNLTEGSAFEISSVKPHQVRDSEIRLNSTKDTLFNPLDTASTESWRLEIMSRYKRRCFTIEEIHDPNFSPDFMEFDTVGLVMYIKQKQEKPNKLVELVYLVNANQDIIVLGFWASIVNQGLENVIKVGNFVTITNIQWRPMGSRNDSFPRGFVQETTLFSLNPTEPIMRENLDRLRNEIENVPEYVSLCEEKLFRIVKSKKFGSDSQNMDVNDNTNDDDEILKTPPLRRAIPPLNNNQNSLGSAEKNKRNLLDEFS